MTPVLSRFWKLNCAEGYPAAIQEIAIIPNPYKLHSFILEARLFAEKHSEEDEEAIMRSTSCEISAEQADMIETEMARIRSNRIRFERQSIMWAAE